jgi:hypothetical protein
LSYWRSGSWLNLRLLALNHIHHPKEQTVSKRGKRWLVTFATVFSILFGVVMLDPVFRQWIFGPKYNGLPLRTWQAFFRDWNVADPSLALHSPSLLDNIHAAMLGEPNSSDWDKLSGEDHRGILLSLADDPKEVVRLALEFVQLPAQPDRDDPAGERGCRPDDLGGEVEDRPATDSGAAEEFACDLRALSSQSAR